MPETENFVTCYQKHCLDNISIWPILAMLIGYPSIPVVSLGCDDTELIVVCREWKLCVYNIKLQFDDWVTDKLLLHQSCYILLPVVESSWSQVLSGHVAALYPCIMPNIVDLFCFSACDLWIPGNHCCYYVLAFYACYLLLHSYCLRTAYATYSNCQLHSTTRLHLSVACRGLFTLFFFCAYV